MGQRLMEEIWKAGQVYVNNFTYITLLNPDTYRHWITGAKSL
jgi:hypothetical protein